MFSGRVLFAAGRLRNEFAELQPRRIYRAVGSCFEHSLFKLLAYCALVYGMLGKLCCCCFFFHRFGNVLSGFIWNFMKSSCAYGGFIQIGSH